MAGYSISSTMGLLLLALFAVGTQAQLQQSFCSNQNTGGSNPPNFSIYQSNGLCFDSCKDQYAFAVVQYQNCWCSNFAPSSTVDDSDCSQQCPGFPNELCGNEPQGLFGYIALQREPSGTAGASPTRGSQTRTQQNRPPPVTSSDPPPSSSSEEPSTSAAPPTTEASPRPSTNESPPPPPTTSRRGRRTTSTTTPPSTSSTPSPSTVDFILTPSSSTPSTSSTASVTESEAPVTSTQVVTVSGAVVTQFVTSTPRPRVSGTAADNLQERPSQSSTPTGVIVGAVVGTLAGLAFILLALFLLWRRRRRDDRRNSGNSGSSRINRNASILSKAGLLATGRNNNDAEKSMEEPRYGSQRQSALYDPPESPISAPGGVYETSSHASRRNSRPLVYDQRLNPAAIMQDWEGNGSRTSIGTMQDQRDYSRPLGITNPDLD